MPWLQATSLSTAPSLSTIARALLPVLRCVILGGTVAVASACGPGPQAMHDAVTQNRRDVVEQFLQQRPALLEDPLHSKSQRGSRSVILSRPLYAAAKVGHLDMVTLLLDRGADINGTGVRGQTPLFIAAREGRMPVVALLLARRADIHARSESGTALHGAAGGEEADIVALLLDRGARVDALDDTGATPLHAAMGISTQSADRVLLLVDHGAQVNARNSDGDTPLHMVGNNPWSASVLCARGADLEARNTAGKTPVDRMADSNDPAFHRWFLSDDGCRGLAATYRKDGRVSDERRRFAVEVYKCAADYKGGCNNMGVAYMAGRGVAADPVRAVDLYRKACDAGDMVGCFNLGRCLEAGRGVARDPGQARAMLKRACAGGYTEACP